MVKNSITVVAARGGRNEDAQNNKKDRLIMTDYSAQILNMGSFRNAVNNFAPWYKIVNLYQQSTHTNSCLVMTEKSPITYPDLQLE